MTWLQFRVLYREFLFRVVDLELLSPQGDMTKLLGQFASLLIFLSLLLSGTALGAGDGHMPHTVIATTMVVVGLFAVLSWDSTFPDRRDALVLAPLPVRASTIFLAKVAASATALSVTVATLNALTGLAWPLALIPASRDLLDLVLSPGLYRSFFAYWGTMISAGAFIFGSVLTVQGLAAQLLPRRQFLRVSALLQMAAFCLLVSVYFLQPSLATPKALTAPENQRLLAWLPSYWFLGLFQELNGSMHPAFAPLARRAWIGLAIVALGTTVAYSLSYFRTLRKIVEEPDIAPGSRGGSWLPRFGNSLETAVTQFSIRTLLRSRQHRVILAFYLGIGFAITILFLKTPVARQQLAGQVSAPLLASSIVMLAVWVVGTRVVFSMPLDLRANWIFRVSPIRGGLECLAARRRALVVLAVIPPLVGAASVFLSIWPWEPAVGHLLILGLLAAILAELCLHGTQKIPFTCSYLPGRSNFHLTFWLCIGLLITVINKGAEFERRALQEPGSYAAMVAILGILASVARWRTTRQVLSEDAELQFDEMPAPAVLALGLHRDGVLPDESSTRSPVA